MEEDVIVENHTAAVEENVAEEEASYAAEEAAPYAVKEEPTLAVKEDRFAMKKYDDDHYDAEFALCLFHHAWQRWSRDHLIAVKEHMICLVHHYHMIIF